MRTAQYAFLLIAQMIMLTVGFTFGTTIVSQSRDLDGTANYSQAPKPPAGQEQDGLLGYLTR